MLPSLPLVLDTTSYGMRRTVGSDVDRGVQARRKPLDDHRSECLPVDSDATELVHSTAGTVHVAQEDLDAAQQRAKAAERIVKSAVDLLPRGGGQVEPPGAHLDVHGTLLEELMLLQTRHAYLYDAA